jgi:hypothetical protein
VKSLTAFLPQHFLTIVWIALARAASAVDLAEHLILKFFQIFFGDHFQVHLYLLDLVQHLTRLKAALNKAA